MAKYCGNCGNKLDDDARVCDQCGTPWGGQNVNHHSEKTKSKKRTGLLILVLLFIIGVLGAVKIIPQYTGYRGFLRKVMSAYEKYDIDALVAMSSDVYYYFDAENAAEESFKDSIGDTMDSFETYVGNNYSLSYEINEIYDMSPRKVSKLMDGIKSSVPDFDVDSIEKIMEAEVTVTAKKGDESNEQNITVCITKEGKYWKLFYFE